MVIFCNEKKCYFHNNNTVYESDHYGDHEWSWSYKVDLYRCYTCYKKYCMDHMKIYDDYDNKKSICESCFKENGKTAFDENNINNISKDFCKEDTKL